MKKFIKSNIKVVVAFIIGAILFGGSAYVLATTIASSSVAYTENGQTTVEGALNTLYTRANIWINPDNFGIQLNSAKTVMATPGGVCIKRNGTVYCFGLNNWAVEKDHIQQVFSDETCYVDSSYVTCYASDFDCNIDSNGYVGCSDRSDNSGCTVLSDGYVDCH